MRGVGGIGIATAAGLLLGACTIGGDGQGLMSRLVETNPPDEFLVVACDGIFDVLTNEELVQTVGAIFREGEDDLGLICEEVRDTGLQLHTRLTCYTSSFLSNCCCCSLQVCDVALHRGSKDNMTVLTVKFPAQKTGTGGGVLARRTTRDAEQKEARKETTV